MDNTVDESGVKKRKKKTNFFFTLLSHRQCRSIIHLCISKHSSRGFGPESSSLFVYLRLIKIGRVFSA